MTAPHVLVVGSGLAGLTCALHAARAGARVSIVTKDLVADGNTRWAQGGIAAAVLPGDTAASHAQDTLVAGVGLSDPAAVAVLVGAAADRIDELIGHGVHFDRDASGALRAGLEAAHAHPRVLHAGGDATGAVIQAALVAAVRAQGIEIVEHALLVDLMRRDGRVAGVDLLRGGRREVREADAVVLATGGAGQLYAHTTNPAGATGDGLAAGLRAGVAVADLEFVQFHPTMLPGGGLVSEAVRGEGATLIDTDGRRFVFDAHPDGELAPRDVVARAIATAMARQGGRPVRLDATGVRATPDETAAFLAARFPTIDAAVRARGWDWARRPIPVTPAAHYLMGGIVTDLDARTSLPGLYAVGEVARTGVHGANRLASNSLLEAAVFGARAGDRVVADVAEIHDDPAARPVPTAGAPAAESAGGHRTSGERFSRAALQRLCWERVGLGRDEIGLAGAATTLAHWAETLPPPTTRVAVEDRNLVAVARAIVAAARLRRDSVGAHVRTDDEAARATARATTAPATTAAEWEGPASHGRTALLTGGGS